MSPRPVLGVVAYVMRGDEVLLVHRTARADDPQRGLYNGLGGKVEPDEDVIAAIRRELTEEAGIQATSLTLRGTVSWPIEAGPGTDWFGFVFRVDAFRGEPPPSNVEGTLHWVPLALLSTLELPAGDERWLPWVFDPTVAQFAAVMPYRDGRPCGWSASVLPTPGGGVRDSDALPWVSGSR